MIRPSSDLAIVVVNFGSSRLLEINLARSSRDGDVVVVVDCFSSEPERTRITAVGANHGWDVVLLDDNRGFGGGMNAGMARAAQLGATRFLLLNPDAVIDAESITALESVVLADPLALVSPRVVDSHDRTWFAGADVDLEDGATRAIAARARHPHAETWEWISGACMMLTNELRSLVGGFDEDFFLYWEDVDLSRRAINVGGRLHVEESAVARHDEGGTHEDQPSSRAKSGTYYRYMIRNRMLFAVKHLDFEGVERWRRSDVRSAWAVLMQGGRRQLVSRSNPVGAALSGLLEGRRIASDALRSWVPRSDSES